MPPRPHSPPPVLHIHLLALLLVLVSLRPVLVTAQRVPPTVRPVPPTARQARHILLLRRPLARLLGSHLPAQYTARQVHHTRLRAPVSILKPPASNKAPQAQCTVLLVHWAIRLRVLNSLLDQIQDPSVHLQAHRSGRLL